MEDLDARNSRGNPFGPLTHRLYPAGCIKELPDIRKRDARGLFQDTRLSDYSLIGRLLSQCSNPLSYLSVSQHLAGITFNARRLPFKCSRVSDLVGVRRNPESEVLNAESLLLFG